MWPSLKEILNSFRKEIEKLEVPHKNEINRIFIFGFGGSGIVGKIFENLSFLELEKEIKAFNVTKVPRYLTDKDFAILISYSGNTIELLDIHNELRSKNIKHITITSDGILKSMCKNTILLPRGLLSREAFPYIFLALASIIERIFAYPIYPVISKFEELRPAIESLNIKFRKEPVVIYSWYLYYPAALRLKYDLNENVKMQAYSVSLPEACHNEIEGAKEGTFVILRGSREDKDIVDTFIELLPKKAIEIKVRNAKYLVEILSMFYLSDVVSIKEAEARKINWKITPKIERYKKEVYEKKK